VGDIGSDGHTMSRPIGRRAFRISGSDTANKVLLVNQRSNYPHRAKELETLSSCCGALCPFHERYRVVSPQPERRAATTTPP
jgi:hypothetical protein